VASFQNKRAQAKALQNMKSRVAKLQARVTRDMDDAFEALLQGQPDLSFTLSPLGTDGPPPLPVGLSAGSATPESPVTPGR